MGRPARSSCASAAPSKSCAAETGVKPPPRKNILYEEEEEEKNERKNSKEKRFKRKDEKRDARSTKALVE